jgi:hypothetical protein
MHALGVLQDTKARRRLAELEAWAAAQPPGPNVEELDRQRAADRWDKAKRLQQRARADDGQRHHVRASLVHARTVRVRAVSPSASAGCACIGGPVLGGCTQRVPVPRGEIGVGGGVRPVCDGDRPASFLMVMSQRRRLILGWPEAIVLSAGFRRERMEGSHPPARPRPNGGQSGAPDWRQGCLTDSTAGRVKVLVAHQWGGAAH